MKNSLISNLNKKQLEIDNKYSYSNKNLNIELKGALKGLNNFDTSISLDFKNKKNKEFKVKDNSALSSNLRFIKSKNKSRNSYSKLKIQKSLIKLIKKINLK